MKPRNLYVLEVALAVAAALALVLLADRHGELRTGLSALWPWSRQAGEARHHPQRDEPRVDRFETGETPR